MVKLAKPARAPWWAVMNLIIKVFNGSVSCPGLWEKGHKDINWGAVTGCEAPVATHLPSCPSWVATGGHPRGKGLALGRPSPGAS